MATCINTRVHMDACIYYTCPYGRVYLLHVSIWTRVFITRVQVDTCIKYTWPTVFNQIYIKKNVIKVLYTMHNNISIYMYNDTLQTLCI